MPRENSFTLLLSGDSIIQRRYVHLDDPDVQELIKLVRSADVAFTNLEVLPNDFEGHPAVESGGTHFGAPRWVLDELLAMGFDLFACATNHALDYSIAGLEAMLDTLVEREATFAGVGRNLAEARMPAYFDHRRGSVALIAACTTFAKGQPAGPSRLDFRGRPGLNPLRHRRTFELPEAQLAQVRQISEDLGLEAYRRMRVEMGFARDPEDPDIFPFLEERFRAAEQARVVTELVESDFDDQLRWLAEARARADHVIASLHTHEQGATPTDPPDFVRAFAQRVIDAGADVVVMHGPHQLRGIELHEGKPIFYSLGNLFGQNELTYILPADNYERFGAEPDALPSQAFETRSNGGNGSFPAFRQYWESVVPVCTFDDGELAGIDIVPVVLGFGQPVHRRGRPRIARNDEAVSILERLAELSRPFGTQIDVVGERARVRLHASQ